ncbi:MAG: hypothetical protein LC652_10820 [Halomonas sp.]|nr:hypothetical protein [Halomonas sp.]
MSKTTMQATAEQGARAAQGSTMLECLDLTRVYSEGPQDVTVPSSPPLRMPRCR